MHPTRDISSALLESQYSSSYLRPSFSDNLGDMCTLGDEHASRNIALISISLLEEKKIGDVACLKSSKVSSDRRILDGRNELGCS